LLQPSKESPRRPELLGEDAYARPVAEQVVLAEYVHHVEPRLHLAEGGQLEAVGDTEVELLIRRIARVVRVPDRAPQAAADQQVEAEPRAMPQVAETGRRGDELAVVSHDVVLVDVGQVVQ